MKPMKVKPNIKSTPFSQPKFIQPVKLNIYPKRTKQEIRLIDKSPWGDRDKDKVPNWFDCKPMNRKKQGTLIGRKDGKDVTARSIDMIDIPEKIKNTKIENLNQFKKIKNKIEEIESKRFSGKQTVKPFFTKALTTLHTKGYSSEHPKSIYNEDKIVHNIIIDNRLNQDLIDEINMNKDHKAKIGDDTRTTIITFNQKGKTLAEIEKEMLNLAEKLPMQSMSPNIKVSPEILKRMNKIEEKNFVQEDEILTSPVIRDETHYDDLRQFKGSGIMEEDLNTQVQIPVATQQGVHPNLKIHGTKPSKPQLPEFEVKDKFTPVILPKKKSQRTIIEDTLMAEDLAETVDEKKQRQKEMRKVRFKKWRESNREAHLKHNREYYRAYRRTAAHIEKTRLRNLIYRNKASSKLLRKLREMKPEIKKRIKELDALPKNKKARADYRKTPKGKAAQKAYHESIKNTPEFKAKKDVYNSKIEVKARRQAYAKARSQKPEVISKQRIAKIKWREHKAIRTIKEMVPGLDIEYPSSSQPIKNSEAPVQDLKEQEPTQIKDLKEQEPTQDIIEIESIPIDTPTENTDDYGYDYDTSSQKLIDDVDEDVEIGNNEEEE